MRSIARVFAISLALALPAVAFVPRPALAQTQHVLLTACNDTTVPIWVAIGEVSDPFDDWRSKGWWKVQGGECLYTGSWFTDGVGFNVYAQAADGTNWSGSSSSDDYYCVDVANAFELADGWRAHYDDNCPAGFTLKHFRYIPTPSGYGDDENFSYTYHFHM